MSKRMAISVILSIIFPGIGHIYLHSLKIGLPLLIASIIVSALMFYVTDLSIIIIPYIAILIFAIVHCLRICRNEELTNYT